MHALQNIHASLVPDGVLIDTQPISAHPPISANGGDLGTLDMREWIETIRAVDQRVDDTIAGGLFELTAERHIVVTSTFDDGPDCLEIAGNWRGTRVAQPLAERLAVSREQVCLQQEVRLRVFRPEGLKAVTTRRKRGRRDVS